MICRGCKTTVEVGDLTHRHLRRQVRTRVRCDSCAEKETARVTEWRSRNRAKCDVTSQRWRDANPASVRRAFYWTYFRVSDIDALFLSQRGECAACGLPMLVSGREPQSMCVDHDRSCCNRTRSCGKCVRGLIHRNCNLALGYAKDDAATIRAAVEYLRRWRETSCADPSEE